MTRKDTRYPSADDTLRSLGLDPAAFVSREQREKDLRRLREAEAAALAPLLVELQTVGFSVDSLDQLRESGRDYRTAIPVFLRWLPQLPEACKETVFRTLTVPWAGPQATAVLIEEFRYAKDPILRWVIGNALSVTANESARDDLCDLVEDKRYGRAREMVAVALGRLKSPRARQVLLRALADPEVAGHAVMAIGQLGDPGLLPEIEPFLKHSKRWIRQEAAKAIKRLKRKAAPSGARS